MAVGGRRAAAAACGRWCLVILAVASALGVSGPALYWRYKKGFSSPASAAAAPSCPPCTCDCPPPLSLQSIAPGLMNFSISGICARYEKKIMDINPMARNFTYDITDLYNFIDGLADISALVYDHQLQAFLPYDRQWIKQKMFQHLKNQARQ